MARFAYGGDFAHVAASPDPYPSGYLRLSRNTVAQFYDAQGGALVTDFLLFDQNAGTYSIAATQVTTTDSGVLPRFQAADGLSKLWILMPDGTWLQLQNNDALTNAVAAAQAAQAAAEAAAGSTAGVTSITQAVPGTPQTGAVTLSATSVGAAPASHEHSPDQISGSTTTGRSLLTAVDATAARNVIGAYNAPAGMPMMAYQSYSVSTAARGTSRTDVCVVWVAASVGLAQPTNMLSGDLWIQQAA